MSAIYNLIRIQRLEWQMREGFLEEAGRNWETTKAGIGGAPWMAGIARMKCGASNCRRETWYVYDLENTYQIGGETEIKLLEALHI